MNRRNVIVCLVVVSFLVVGYLFYHKDPDVTMVQELAPTAPVTEESVSSKIVVYVTGAVVTSDVYSMPAGARVGDVLTLAVLTDEADPEQLNLAEPLVDGTKIHVPKIGETEPVTAEESETVNGVHVNSATKEELMTVPGIGPAKADAILAHLKQNGPFRSYEALGDVKGFGEKTLESMKPYLLVP